MDQKLLFVADCARDLDPVAEVCRRYKVSRKTGYKWIDRFKEQGLDGLAERSRRPHHCPDGTPADVVHALLEARRHHPTWGPKKLLALLARLSRLSVWWIRLGIFPELIEPAHPEQNARHERMHRTLKQETARPPAEDHRAQQKRFDQFCHVYNHERPHEALGQQTPASHYRPSERSFPSRLPKIEYPGHYELRRVSRNGGVRWKNQWVCVTHVLAEEYVGFDEVDNGLWEVFYGPVRLGRFNERDSKIEDDRGRKLRKNVLPMS